MNQITCLFEELDDETRAYLQEVRSRQGNRTPGIYFGDSNSWPIVAFLFGPVIMILAVVQGYLSTKDAWAVALLQTAGVMLGGWMVLYAFRRWFASSRKFAGFFTYFDPTHVYQVNGDAVTVTDVSDFSAVHVHHRSSGSTYHESLVSFDLNGRRLGVRVAGRDKADLVEAYYCSLVKLEEHDDRKWRDLRAAEMGGVAKHVATLEEMPFDPTDVRLEVAEIPAAPKRVGRAAPGAMRYLAIFAIGGLIYFGFLQANDPVRDARAFAQAQTGGAAALRGYMIDPRNTRHRDEAVSLLAKLYDAPIARVESQVKDPDAKRGLLAILQALREAPQPVVSIDVREKDTPKEDAMGASGRENRLRTDLADALATHLGKDLIGFVKAPEGQPAHFELVYTLTPFGSDWRGPMVRASWQLRLRADPAVEPVELSPRMLEKSHSVKELDLLTEALRVSVFQEVFGQNPPVIPPLPIGGGGDF